MISHDEDFLRLNRNRETICRLSSKEEIKKKQRNYMSSFLKGGNKKKVLRNQGELISLP